jgi:uncharacterized protein YkuJ
MAITNKMIDQVCSDLRATCGDVRQDYFGLLYLEREFGVPREVAIKQVAFGGNDFGIDGFHFDTERRNLYLFQFKWSEDHGQFKGSFRRLIDAGMDRIFATDGQVQNQNQLFLQLKSRLLHDQNLIDKVFVQFVYNGDPAEAERSSVLDKLREDLEGKKYLIDQYFERQVTMVFEFRSAKDASVGTINHVRKTHTYTLQIDDSLNCTGPSGEVMNVGFVRLVDLMAMYREMGQRFFERNIRAGLSEEKSVNRAISKAFKSIILDGSDDPRAFAFNHNGVTIAAEKIERSDETFRITEPRRLNGAQTVTTYARFLTLNEGNEKLKAREAVASDLRLLCKIISKATPEFITAVTINNNRQNPVEPWNLHANDLIQLELQDKFRDDLGIYYERQENAFSAISDDALEEAGITQFKAIQLLRLAQTLLVADGDIDKLSRMREVFENDKVYAQVFNSGRLKADSRKIILCYKVQFRLRKLVAEIMDKGANKYWFMGRARYLLWALLCQGILNDPKLEHYAEEFGEGLSVEADFTDWLAKLASTRCRLIVKDAVGNDPYAKMIREERYDFLRTNAMYKKCMEAAYEKYHWLEKRLK